MSTVEIISQEPLSLAELKKEIIKIKKRDEELNFRTGKTEEYLNHFSKLDAKKSAELRKALEGLNIPRLKPEHLVKIIDILPNSESDVKLIFQGSTLTLTNDNAKKIADLVKKSE